MLNPQKLSENLLFFNFRSIIAQQPPAEKWVKIMVSPVRSDWKYSVREKVKFNVKVFKGNVLWEGVKISYEIGSEKMPSTLVKEEILKDGMLTIDGGMMKIAGFLRCTVKTEYQGKSFREWTTAGFSPKKLNQQLCSLLILRIFGIKPSKRIPNSR